MKKQFEETDPFRYFLDYQLAIGGIAVAVVLGAGLLANVIIPGSGLIVMGVVLAAIIVLAAIGLVSWVYHYFKGERD